MFYGIILAVLLAATPLPSDDNHSYVVIYSIQDLQMVIPDYGDAPLIDLNSALQGHSPLQENHSAVRRNNGADVISLIESVVEPDAWGVEASIRYYGGNIIVNAPKRIHDQIR